MWAVNNCAEVDAVNQTLKDGSSRVDLAIATVRTKNGEPFPCCNNCSVTFGNYRVLTGKKR